VSGVRGVRGVSGGFKPQGRGDTLLSPVFIQNTAYQPVLPPAYKRFFQKKQYLAITFFRVLWSDVCTLELYETTT